MTRRFAIATVYLAFLLACVPNALAQVVNNPQQQPPANNQQQPPANNQQQPPANNQQQPPANNQQQPPANNQQQPQFNNQQQPPPGYVQNYNTPQQLTVSPNLAATKFIAGLFWSSTTTGLHRRCAATIVANNVLLTSASCTLDKYPTLAYGPGQWVVITEGDSRFTQNLTAGAATPAAVKSIDIDQCANLATITLATPLVLGDKVKPILMNSAEVPFTAMLNTYNTKNAYGSPFLALTQGNREQCEALKPFYAQDRFVCTQPVQGQLVTSDYLGGDPIIGFSVQNNTPTAVLVGISGQFYSRLVYVQTGRDNDPAAYRFSALVGSRIGQIASIAGVNAATITSSNPLG